MKLLIEIDAPGIEHFHVHEPDVPIEIAAFVRSLVKSRTRGPEPKVSVHVVHDDSVIVDAGALIRLQQKAGAK